jgi:hypothetical protein
LGIARRATAGTEVIRSTVEDAPFVIEPLGSVSTGVRDGGGAPAPVAVGTRAHRVEELPEDAQPASNAAASAPTSGWHSFNTRALC